MNKSAFSIILISCVVSSCGLNRRDCNESIEFKKRFDYHVRTIDLYMGVEDHESTDRDITEDVFFSSLDSLSRFVDVDLGSTMNYVIDYPNEEYYLDIRTKWLEWNEDHKCEHLQWVMLYFRR